MITDSIISLQFKPVFRAFKAEAFVFWSLCIYIFFEYLRPQQMYPIIDFLPWGQLTLIICLVSIIATQSKPNSFTKMDLLFILFSLVVLLSSFAAWNPAESIKYWTLYTSWVLMYFCVVSILTTPTRILLFAIFFILINFKWSFHGAYSFASRGFSFAHWGVAGSGYFRNSGELAMQMVVMFSLSWAILIHFKERISSVNRWRVLMVLFPGTAFLTVIASSSRGGQLALLAVLGIMIFKGGKFFKKLLATVLIASAIMLVMPQEQIDQFRTMGDDETSVNRLKYWDIAIEVINDNPVFGIGYKNWQDYAGRFYQFDRIEEIHNTFLEAFVDLGYPGGILFLLMLTAMFIMNKRTQNEMKNIESNESLAISALAAGLNLGMIGTLIASFFMSVLFYPPFWLAFALTSSLRQLSRKLNHEQNKHTRISRRRNIAMATSQNVSS